MNPHELKAMQGQLAKANADEKASREAFEAAERTYHAAKGRVATLEKQIVDASQEPMVTEHALLRYIERIYGVDMNELKAEILTPSLTSTIRKLGSGKYPLPLGGSAVVKGLHVVSITD